jgi:hypothetical protein
MTVVLTLNRLAYMSKALCRYVGFLRAVNGGQISGAAVRRSQHESELEYRAGISKEI